MNDLVQELAALHIASHYEQIHDKRDDPYLTALPSGFLPFEEFMKKFKLERTSTEQPHPLTKTLSQTMHKKVVDGLSLLVDVDEKVIGGLEQFIPTIESLAPSIAASLQKGGRVFLVGSGSSGRVAVDIAAKCNLAFSNVNGRIRGVIAGGDDAMFRAKEGFEDSEKDGRDALKDENLGLNDTVILISASGLSSFNVGAGHFVAERGAKGLYFYNSTGIPDRTENLFKRSKDLESPLAKNPLTPLCVDIGPQAITGSTRLQGASLAEVCLGALLGTALYLNNGQEQTAKEYSYQLLEKMQAGIKLIRNSLEPIAKIVEKEKEVFSDPCSNFRQLKDLTDIGYITFLALEDCIREVLIDSTETSPTFSTNPIRRESELQKKRAEFCAYLVGKKDNQEAWKALLGRDVQPGDVKNTEAFILACEAEGANSYRNRPIREGNLVIGVAKVKDSQPFSQELMNLLEDAKKKGSHTALLLICKGNLTEKQAEQLKQFDGLALAIENVPDDPMGLIETIVLKQTLNLISNGSMVLMNKVHGNRMIDVRASNNKLISRCMLLTKDIWSEHKPQFVLSDRELYHYIAHISVIKKTDEENGNYTPSVVKIVLAMLALTKTPGQFQEVVEHLAKQQERIDWIGG